MAVQLPHSCSPPTLPCNRRTLRPLQERAAVPQGQVAPFLTGALAATAVDGAGARCAPLLRQVQDTIRQQGQVRRAASLAPAMQLHSLLSLRP